MNLNTRNFHNPQRLTAASAEETAKYEVKSADYMTVDDERNLVVIKKFGVCLSWNTTNQYGGLFKQIKQDLKLEDVENGDLIHVGDEDYTKEQMEAAEEVVDEENHGHEQQTDGKTG
ncbi:protein rep [Levilactobacillus brevis]